MKVLILGAKGKLGVALTKEFEDEHTVIAWGRDDIDITDLELTRKKIIELAPGLILNAASYNFIDKCERKHSAFALAKKVNAEAVANIADAAIGTGSVLVHFSTDYVFDRYAEDFQGDMLSRVKQEGGFKEDDPVHPINKYGESKALGEKELIKRSGKGLKWYLVRTSKLFGESGKSLKSRPCFFENLLVQANYKKEIQVVDDEISCFTYTADLAKAVHDLFSKDYAYGIYHISNSAPSSWYKAALELFRLQGNSAIRVIPVRTDEYPHAAKRPRYSILLSTKFPQMRDWREALREYLEKKY